MDESVYNIKTNNCNKSNKKLKQLYNIILEWVLHTIKNK